MCPCVCTCCSHALFLQPRCRWLEVVWQAEVSPSTQVWWCACLSAVGACTVRRAFRLFRISSFSTSSSLDYCFCLRAHRWFELNLSWTLACYYFYYSILERMLLWCTAPLWAVHMRFQLWVSSMGVDWAGPVEWLWTCLLLGWCRWALGEVYGQACGCGCVLCLLCMCVIRVLLRVQTMCRTLLLQVVCGCCWEWAYMPTEVRATPAVLQGCAGSHSASWCLLYVHAL
jgi:hypothetical protein